MFCPRQRDSKSCIRPVPLSLFRTRTRLPSHESVAILKVATFVCFQHHYSGHCRLDLNVLFLCLQYCHRICGLVSCQNVQRTALEPVRRKSPKEQRTNFHTVELEVLRMAWTLNQWCFRRHFFAWRLLSCGRQSHSQCFWRCYATRLGKSVCL